ncbi:MULTISPECIES: very short patch repair endonuclease [unclassified Arthrobacter]|uniref:very short patch repair endonuclease n=1 Tax=unclassified Arthrobacter TaxID=235627 RepID=UPI001E53725E|nr:MULTISPECIES: very short patch repair endonuclease [unclassified Arthrobacter]MCC9145881.1 very short patch repair endonuclease [Arthrobacter sp. zg-Y919]MDK1277110.1 very short patch repair endonuclease [Arthrobacter sp. zg.Y919]WIB03633.1 very short patch repair endonuclease [Arthrobacter sp. zg-Y919]
MADTVTPEQRSRNMSRIRGKNTKPELLIRSILHAAGYRFRLHGSFGKAPLPGKPDLVFAGRRKVLFVNGCFWHFHSCLAGQRAPKTNSGFWAAKRNRTVERDAAAQARLEAEGWDVLVVWECELKDRSLLEQQLRTFLGPPGRVPSVPAPLAVPPPLDSEPDISTNQD